MSLFKLLRVAAEGTGQFVTVNTVTLDSAAMELLDPILSVVIDTAVLARDKAILQGTITKNILYKATTGAVLHQSETIPFFKEVVLPGLNPNVTIGRANRLVPNNNIIQIGPDNRGTNAGIDVQIFITRLEAFQILVNSTTVDEKIILDCFVKVSKFVQQELVLPTTPRVFECRSNVTINS